MYREPNRPKNNHDFGTYGESFPPYWGDWCVISFFVIVDFFPPLFSDGFCLKWIVMRTLSMNPFPVKIILHSSWYPPLIYVFVIIFFQCGLLCFFVLFFFLSTWYCQYYMNYWTHPPFKPNGEDSRKCKKYLINYIGLHICVKCDQKNLFLVPAINQ